MAIALHHLRYAIAAAEHGSFRQAAAALGVEASAISRGIRDLEEGIGASLFSRHSGGVRPTAAGDLFLTRARNAMGEIARAEHDVGAIGRGERGTLRIGIHSSLTSGFLYDLFKDYDTRHPEVSLDYIERGPSELIPAIRQRNIDVAFLIGTPDADGCDMAHLWNERVYVAMAENDELTVKQAVDWEDLHGRQFVVTEIAPGPQIRDYLATHLREMGGLLQIETQAVYRDSLMQIVASSERLTLVREAVTTIRFPGITYRGIIGETLPLCAVWSPKNDNPAFRRLLSLAKSSSKKCADCLERRDCKVRAPKH